ncbi:MAG: Lysine exporter protein [Rhizobacter sp.]|jgi:threonine/homoserine/homoserine lactone efflux protein|nr:Lysine exporter protein [Rhizobacter sp.]
MIHDLTLFLLAAAVVNLTPGPDMLFVLGRSAADGRRAGVLAALGVFTGCLLHVLLAALGVSALLATSPWAFDVLKWAGAAYLVWAGLSMLLRRGQAGSPENTSRVGSPFWQGALTNALNPKVALFFLAFVPQFITPGSGSQAWAFVALGMVFNVGGLVVNGLVALGASAASRRLAAGGAATIQRVAGVLFVGLGLRLALISR